ncbi:zinc ABC transporter substrate-binding protein [Devosia albogilva]|uniref:High-affinity zinc uptake system protein ZnuA n=1 Tax=Devosia albogilva TaxID=429726 RepID=A0ABW5QLU9_9HYPH
MQRALPILAGLLLLTTSATAAPAVVATTKPIHSLVSSVMAGVGEPDLLVDGAASPHTYSLKPSDAAALESADVVFWTGHGMELFLGDALGTLSDNATLVELAETPGLELLPMREGGAFEAHEHEGHDHDHDHDHEGHDHAGHDHAQGDADMHFWLDPDNAALMVTHIGEVLAEADPANAATYAANAAATVETIDALEAELETTLAPVADRPFIVFHDAYQYFEHRFGLAAAGSITVSPEVLPGAARIDELRHIITDRNAVCVFAEPNFEPALVATVTEATPARAGTLDPEGSALEAGPELYAELMRGLAAGMVECLGE